MFSIFNIPVRAKDRDKKEYADFTYGVEWGYVGTFHTAYRYVFFPPEGYRVDTRSSRLGLAHNADMYVHAGWNMNRHWNMYKSIQLWNIITWKSQNAYRLPTSLVKFL